MTWERLKGTSAKLDELNSMVADISTSEGDAASTAARELVGSLESSFMERMNDDLDVKGAFDSLFSTLKKLHALAIKDHLSGQVREAIERSLIRINVVLGVIDPFAPDRS